MKLQQRKHFRRVPFGYIQSTENPEWDIPDPEVAPYLEEALDSLNKGNSLRETAAWLSSKTGKDISHVTLRWVWHTLCPDAKANVKTLKRKKPKTKEERELLKKKKAVAAEKRRITEAHKRLSNLTGEVETIKEEMAPKPHLRLVGSSVDTQSLSIEVKENIAFEPNPGPQTEFLASDEREVLYGGAAGGGKSFALLADPMRYFYNPHFSGLIVRRTNDELRNLIRDAQMLYNKAFGKKIVWREQKSTFLLPGGGTLWFSYLDRDQDVVNYIGQAYNYIAFDELTQHPTPYAWNFMRSRLRATEGSGLPLYMRATSNPGGPGHGWVKKMFVDPAPYGEAFWATDIDTGEILKYPKDFEKVELRDKPLFKRRFIPATLKDNPYLYKDGQYEINLLALPESTRRQLLYGDWAVADGAAFPEFNITKHTCKPFPIPNSWRRFRSCDFGYASASAVHWYAVDPDGRLYIYREYYTSKKTAKELAYEILKLEKEEHIIYGVLDSSTWAKRGEVGPSIAEEMISAGCRWRPSDRTPGSRAAGKNRLHELLKLDPKTEKPGIIFFDTCRQIIADLQVIPNDPDGEDDIDDKYATDHAYDSIRYGIMSRPRPATLLDSPDYQKRYRPADKTFG